MLTGGVLWLLQRFRRISVDLLKIKAVVWYVRGVGVARRLFIGMVGLAFLLALAVSGFLLIHIGIYALLPAPANAIVLLSLGVIYLLTAVLVLRWACSEKTWMKYSKADHYVELATRKPPPNS